MAALVINTLDDLRKLEGWTIKKAFKASDRPAAVAMVISHQAAENDVMIIFDAVVNMGRSGQVVIANENIKITVKDVIEPEKD